MRLNTVECSVGIDNYDDTILIIMVLGGAVAGTHYRLNIRAGAPLIQSYGFCTPVTQRQVLIEINFQAPETL